MNSSYLSKSLVRVWRAHFFLFHQMSWGRSSSSTWSVWSGTSDSVMTLSTSIQLEKTSLVIRSSGSTYCVKAK